MLIPFKNCVKILNSIKKEPITGVIHIGAHHAEEASDYANEGVERVFWIEANNQYMDKIEAVSKAAGLKTNIVTGYAISNVDDEVVELNVTNNGQSSSILNLGTHKTMYPHIEVVEKFEMKTRTFKTLFNELKEKYESELVFEDFQFINIDIQGAELLALQGFGELLHSPSLKGIYLEINFEEVYEKCPLVEEIDEYLAQFGFFRSRTEVTPYNWGDALYERVAEKEVELSYTNSTVNGPGKVTTNLILGLEKLGVEIKSGSKNLGILQPTAELNSVHSNRNVLVGPNVFVLPSDMPMVVKHFDNFVVPSHWVQNLYSANYQEALSEVPVEQKKGKVIQTSIWSAGIDTQKWKPTNSKKVDNECFIYFKNRSETELDLLRRVFEAQGFKVSVLRYGSYTEQQLFEACERCSFCVLLDNTESQGIAVMEILSMNVPVFVMNTNKWTQGTKSYPATSVPYFNSLCGLVVENHLSKESVTEFLRNLKNYKPRQFILSEHTLIQAAGKYMKCFK